MTELIYRPLQLLALLPLFLFFCFEFAQRLSCLIDTCDEVCPRSFQSLEFGLERLSFLGGQWLRLIVEAAAQFFDARFRSLVREAHPDHGAADEGAAQRIADLPEARRILLT